MAPSLAWVVAVMGVSGVGKTTVAQALAQRWRATFIEGDAHHPAANLAKMTAGIPLDDDDRWPWLDGLAAVVAAATSHGPVVFTCSALRRRYRDRLRRSLPTLHFVYLEAGVGIVRERSAARREHFASPALVPSQFAALEPPQADEAALVVDAQGSLPAILEHIAQGLGRPFAPDTADAGPR